MKRISQTILTLMVVLLLLSCTNDIKNPSDLSGDSWSAVFEEYWAVMNEDYVHFAYESVDWDDVYEKYSPLFCKLDYSKEEDTFTAFRYFKEIAWNLSDYHYDLTVKDNFGWSLDVRPGVLQKWVKGGGNLMDFPDISKTEGGTTSFYSVTGGKDRSCTRAEAREYWDKAVSGYLEIEKLGSAFHNPTGNAEDTFYSSTYGSVTMEKEKGNQNWSTFIVDAFSLNGTTWCSGVTKSGVVYIQFTQFVDKGLIPFCYYIANEATMSEEEKEEVKSKFKTYALHGYSNIDDEHRKKIGVIINAFRYLNDAVEKGYVEIDGEDVEIKGIVIDLRCNGGGVADFMNSFMGTFFASDRKVGYARSKMGFSRYDYTPWTEDTLGVWNTKLNEDYRGRVAVIVNGFSVSCSEIAAITAKLLPSALIFGSTTFGGTSGITSREMYQSGEYTGDRIHIFTTTFRYKGYDGRNYESVGIEPDVALPLNTTRDDRFTAAVNWAATGKLE